MEDGPGYKGTRLFLSKNSEEKDSELLQSLRRKKYAREECEEEARYLVFFNVDKILPLIGPGKEE